MAITNFQRTVWSAKIQRALETITGLKNHSDYQFQGDVKYAKEVKILGVQRPTIKTYVPGTEIELETPTDSSQMLKIDQMRYFNFAVEDVDEAQSQPGLMNALSEEAGKGLAEEADKYIAKIVKDGVESTDADEKIASADVTITKSNAISTLEDALAVLYTNNVKTTEELYYEVTPKVFTLLRQSLTELFTENVEMSKKGVVGRYGNALISVENNLPEITTGSGETATTKKILILRTKKAVAYVGQIDKTEAYRPQDAFQDAIKALFVFGAKVVRPKEIYCIKTA